MKKHPAIIVDDITIERLTNYSDELAFKLCEMRDSKDRTKRALEKAKELIDVAFDLAEAIASGSDSHEKMIEILKEIEAIERGEK